MFITISNYAVRGSGDLRATYWFLFDVNQWKQVVKVTTVAR